MTSFRLLVCLMSLTLFSVTVSALEPAPRLSDRELIEALADLKAGQKAILRELDQRFEAVDQRFKAVDQRFESMQNSMDKRFEEFRSDINHRFEEQSNLLIGLMATFGGMMAVMIVIVIWDRSTMIRPFETKVRQIEKQLEPLEPLVLETRQDRQRLQSLLEAVRSLAQNHPEASAILKSTSLL